MATWNRYSDEVRTERETIRAYGLDNSNRWPRVSSYKGQAKRLLAVTLEQQDRIDSLQASQAAAVDLFDCMEQHELEAFASIVRLPVKQVERLIRRSMGG